MYSVDFTDYFNNDLQEIEAYILNQFKNLEAVLDMIELLEEKIEKLEHNPYLYSVREMPKKLLNEYRSFSVGTYLVLYFIEENEKKVVLQAMINERQNTFGGVEKNK